MSVELKTQHTSKGRHLRATWEGGAYIEVSFGPYIQATEVINVWDDEKGEAIIPFTQPALHQALRSWVLEMDAEAKEWAEANDTIEDDWYSGYLENARYS